MNDLCNFFGIFLPISRIDAVDARHSPASIRYDHIHHLISSFPIDFSHFPMDLNQVLADGFDSDAATGSLASSQPSFMMASSPSRHSTALKEIVMPFMLMRRPRWFDLCCVVLLPLVAVPN